MAATKQTMTDEQRKSLALEYLKHFGKQKKMQPPVELAFINYGFCEPRTGVLSKMRACHRQKTNGQRSQRLLTE